METTIEAPAPAATEAPAPQSTEVVQPAVVETAKPETAAPTIDRGARLAEINQRVADKPYDKLSDEDLALYMEGQEGKLKPSEKKEEQAEKPEVKVTEDAMAQTLKKVGAKSIEELPAKVEGLLKQISGKDAQTVAKLTREIEYLRKQETSFKGNTKFIADLKAQDPKALEYLQKEFGVKLPSAQVQSEKPFTEEDDLLVGGALSRQYAREQALEQKFEQLQSKLTEGERRIQQEQTQQKAKSQVVEEIQSVAELIPELKALPNLRNRIIDFQAGKDDPELQVISDLSEMVVSAYNEKGLTLDLETAFHLNRSKNMDAMLEAAKEAGRKEAYNHKPNRSLSAVAQEDTQPETFTQAQYEEMGKPGGFNLIPDKWYTDGSLDKSKMPRDAWKYFGFE